MRPNHIIVQCFKEHMFKLIAAYSEGTGKKVKATLMRTKLNIDTAVMLCKVRPYVVTYGSYIDSGDIDAFLQHDVGGVSYSRNVKKLLKIIATIRDTDPNIASLLESIRGIRDACAEYRDI